MKCFCLTYGGCCFTLAIDRLELFIYLFIYSWQAFVKGKFIFQNGKKIKIISSIIYLFIYL
jgi:hypothetical protein